MRIDSRSQKHGPINGEEDEEELKICKKPLTDKVCLEMRARQGTRKRK